MIAVQMNNLHLMPVSKHIIRVLSNGSRRMTVQNAAVVGARALHSTPPRQGLSPEHTQIIKATVPVLAEHGVTITSHFYKRMLNAHPELKNIFNSAHQATGTQPAALAHSVWAYAANIDNLGALGAAVSRIGHKHASLGVTADQYPIVGEHLLASIKEVLGDAATPAILDAWAAAYQQLADIFINYEKDLYETAAKTPGGWNGWRKFKIARKVHESEEITSFYFEPVDGKSLPAFKPGQYISVRVFVPELGVYQPRQYTLSEAADGKHLRISVKREASSEAKPAGRISNFLHDQTPEGSEMDVAMPYGDFTLDGQADGPVVLISGGVGITPMLSMLGTVTEQAKNRPVAFVHATRNGEVHAMKDYISRITADNPQVSRAIFYEHVSQGDKKGVDYDYEGRIDLSQIKDQVILPDANYYVCGPIPFMQLQKKSLEDLGVPPDRIHMEVFGSGIV